MSPRKQKKLDEFYLRALDELFRRVGFDGYDREFTNQQWWYTLREWTLEEDRQFSQWFADEYRKTFRCSKTIAKDTASMFVSNYGWKVKQEHQVVTGFKR